MHLDRIALFNFKNYGEAALSFGPGVNLISGENGAGKTNLLDAIHYLCLSKSAFTHIDAFAIRHEAPYFSIMGDLIAEGAVYKIICGIKSGDKKVLTVNQVPYQKVSEHIGRFPCVLIAPDHIAIIKESSEERRRFFDNVMSQVDPAYLEQLITYNRYLKGRNQLLKQFYERNYRDLTLLETYSEPLVKSGTLVYNARKAFVEQFRPILQKVYADIATSREQIEVSYESQLHETDFRALNINSTNDDIRAQRTTLGPHLDEYSFLIDGQNLKKFGSQGQQKTFLLALKIAQHHVITELLHKKPIMLLDDIFDKLDDSRIAQLLRMCKSGYFGQVFITDARKDRTEVLLKEADIQARIFEVVQGSVKVQAL